MLIAAPPTMSRRRRDPDITLNEVHETLDRGTMPHRRRDGRSYTLKERRFFRRMINLKRRSRKQPRGIIPIPIVLTEEQIKEAKREGSPHLRKPIRDPGPYAQNLRSPVLGEEKKITKKKVTKKKVS